MTLEASRRERHAVRSQTELEGSLYGLRPSRDAAQPDAARGLGSLMGGGRVPSSSAGCSHQRVVICRVHRATVHGDGARALAAKATLVRGSHALAPSRATRHASPRRAALEQIPLLMLVEGAGYGLALSREVPSTQAAVSHK